MTSGPSDTTVTAASLAAAAAIAGTEPGAPLAVHRERRAITLRYAVPLGVQGIEVHLESERNRAIPRLTDRSPYALPALPFWHAEPDDRDIWFPVVDVSLDPEMEALVVLTHAGSEAGGSADGARGDAPDAAFDGHYVINGFHYRAAHPLAARFAIPATQLEHWENALFVRWNAASPSAGSDESASAASAVPKTARLSLRQFTLRARYALSGGQVFQHTYRLLSDAWEGAVSVWAVEPGEPEERRLLARTAICAIERDGRAVRVVSAPSGRETWDTPHLQRAAAMAPRAPRDIEALLTPERLRASIAESVDYILRSQNTTPWSPTRGGLSLFYDLDAGTYRSAHWMWGSGPAIRLLIDARRVSGLSPALDRARLLDAARAICDSHLRFAIDDPAHPAFGGTINRYVVGYTGPGPHEKHGGYAAFISPADQGWNAGWGWVPLYEATGERRYLEAAERWAAMTERLVQEYDVVPQDFLPWHGSWTRHTIDENGFGTEGFAELFRVTGDRRYQRIGERYIDQCIEKLGREDGLWNRRYDWDTGDRKSVV